MISFLLIFPFFFEFFYVFFISSGDCIHMSVNSFIISLFLAFIYLLFVWNSFLFRCLTSHCFHCDVQRLSNDSNRDTKDVWERTSAFSSHVLNDDLRLRSAHNDNSNETHKTVKILSACKYILLLSTPARRMRRIRRNKQKYKMSIWFELMYEVEQWIK